MPLGHTIWFNKLQPWDAKVRETILMGRVLLKPAHPEDLNLLSPGSAINLLHAFVVDGNREDINESAILIRVGVIAFGRSDHDVRSGAEVGNI